MNRAAIISYIRRIKKDIKKGKHNNLSAYGYRDILPVFKYSPLEIAARFLRRKGCPIEVCIYQIPMGPLCFDRPLTLFRAVSIIY